MYSGHEMAFFCTYESCPTPYAGSTWHLKGVDPRTRTGWTGGDSVLSYPFIAVFWSWVGLLLQVWPLSLVVGRPSGSCRFGLALDVVLGQGRVGSEVSQSFPMPLLLCCDPELGATWPLLVEEPSDRVILSHARGQSLDQGGSYLG